MVGSRHDTIAPLAARIGCETYRVDGGAFDKNALEACDAGITACEAAVAQTGSVLVSSGTCGEIRVRATSRPSHCATTWCLSP